MTDEKFSSEQLALIDPLGEIQRAARELWKTAGSPTNVSWQHFWEEAEQRVMSAGSAPQCAIDRETVTQIPSRINPELRPLIEQADNSLLSICASAFADFLDEHEAICLSHLLRYHVIHLHDERTLAATSVDEVSTLLAELSREYPPAVLGAAQDFQTVRLLERQNYWRKLIAEIRGRDEPLTYSDQNTMNRLRKMLERESRVKDVVAL